ncbi:MAG: helix-turn-helix domain-containing protein [Treponema sp.]|nr:helix-turn-helix domain-containing protein [Treponema sp.]
MRDYLSANIKARREVLGISQEKLAELADVSVQMIKAVEGRRNWVSDAMLVKLAQALGLRAFQLLIPADTISAQNDDLIISGLLRSLKQNILDDINSRFDRLLPTETTRR